MPPQQSDRLLDLIDDCLNFRAHGLSGWLSSFEHDLIRKPAPTLDQVRGRLFGIMLWGLSSDPDGFHKAPWAGGGRNHRHGKATGPVSAPSRPKPRETRAPRFRPCRAK